MHILPGIGFVPRNMQDYAFGGIMVTAWELAIRQSISHQVAIVGLSLSNKHFSHIEYGIRLQGIKVLKFLKSTRIDLNYFIPVLLSVMKFKPDILHVYTNPFLINLPSRYKLIHLQNTLPQYRNQYTIDLLRKAHAVVSCSKFIHKNTLGIYPEINKKAHVVYNGGGDDGGLTRYELRSELGIPEKALVILYVGAINPEKGLDILAKSFARVFQEIPNVFLLVAGSSHLWHDPSHIGSISKYEESIRNILYDKPVRFMGNVARKDMKKVYGSADIFVCPSIWEEPFGIVNIEAMSAGLPVIASAVGGIPEIVNEDVGRLVTPNDVEALNRTIIELLKNDELRSRLAENALKWSKKFTWEITHETIAKIYDHIVEVRKNHK